MSETRDRRAELFSSLIGAAAGTSLESLAGAKQIPLDRLRPNPQQPRRRVNRARLEELIADIQAKGRIMQPIIARPAEEEGTYYVVAGMRRTTAAARLQMPTVPAIIVDLTPEQALLWAVGENLQQEGLDPEDEGRVYAHLHAQGWSDDRIWREVVPGRSETYVLRRRKLIEVPGALDAYRAGRLKLDDLLQADFTPPPVEADDAGEGGVLETEAAPAPAPARPARATGGTPPGKQIEKLLAYVHRLGPALDQVTEDERARLRQAIPRLIEELQQIQQQLDMDA